MSPLCESLRPGGPPRSHGAVLSPPRLRLRAAACWSRWRSPCRPKPHLHRVRLLLVLLRQLARATPRAYVDMIVRAARARPGEPGRGGRQQRRLPAPVLRRPRHPGAGRRAGPQRRRGGRRGAASPRVTELFGRATARGARGRRPPGRPARSATTCSPRCRTSTTSSPAWRSLLAPRGVLTIEFPHLLRLMEENQFDTIYHEHFSYFSLRTARADLRRPTASTLFDVEELPTHGGSLRIYAQPRRRRRAARRPGGSRALMRRRARRRPRAPRDATRTFARAGPRDQAGAARVPHRRPARGASASPATARPARATRCSTTAGSAPTSSSTRWTATPTSRASTCPARRIPIFAPDRIAETRPDYLLILPWNLKEEIVAQMAAHSRLGRAVRGPRSPGRPSSRDDRGLGARRSATGCDAPTSIPSAGASPATGSGRRCAVWASSCPCPSREIPTGTQVLDWTVPPEWNLREAWIESSAGRARSSTRARSTSTSSATAPGTRPLTLAELRPHLFSLPERPDWIPYRTSYYAEDWGFCLSRPPARGRSPTASTRSASTPRSARAASPTGSACSRASAADEILLSTHVCHPSLATTTSPAW